MERVKLEEIRQTIRDVIRESQEDDDFLLDRLNPLCKEIISILRKDGPMEVENLVEIGKIHGRNFYTLGTFLRRLLRLGLIERFGEMGEIYAVKGDGARAREILRKRIPEPTGTRTEQVLAVLRQNGPMTAQMMVKDFTPNIDVSSILSIMKNLTFSREVINLGKARSDPTGYKSTVWGLPGQELPVHFDVGPPPSKRRSRRTSPSEKVYHVLSEYGPLDVYEISEKTGIEDLHNVRSLVYSLVNRGHVEKKSTRKSSERSRGVPVALYGVVEKEGDFQPDQESEV